MNKEVTGISLNANVIGKVTINIPFTGLKLFIDVVFLVLRQCIPTLMSIQDIIFNGLDLSLQQKYVSHGTRVHKLAMENLFLFHGCTNDELAYAIYSAVE